MYYILDREAAAEKEEFVVWRANIGPITYPLYEQLDTCTCIIIYHFLTDLVKQ